MKTEIKKLIEEFVANMAAGNKSDAHTSFNHLIEQMIAARIKEKQDKLFETKSF